MTALIDSRATRIIFTVLIFAMGLAFLYVARKTLIAFLFAVFFAYLVDPAVSRVERWTKGRGSAITAIYLLIVLGLGTLFFFIGPRIGHEAQKLTESLPSLMERVNSGQIVQEIGVEHGVSKTTRDQMENFFKSHT
jgi:predicted PurR-regulated permease PerM